MSVPEIETTPKIGAELPEIVVVPEKVMVLEVSVELELLTKFPFRLIELEPALKLPLERVKIPFTVMLDPKVKVPEPVFDKLANAEVLLGSSGPLVIVPEVYTTL